MSSYSDIAKLIQIIETETGLRVTLSSQSNLLDKKTKSNRVGRPSKLSDPILGLVVKHVLYKAYYEEIVIKRSIKPLSIVKACEELAKEHLIRRSPELGALRFNIIDKTTKKPKLEVIAKCANTIRRVYYLGYKRRHFSDYISSMIQSVHMATNRDRWNSIGSIKN